MPFDPTPVPSLEPADVLAQDLVELAQERARIGGAPGPDHPDHLAHRRQARALESSMGRSFQSLWSNLEPSVRGIVARRTRGWSAKGPTLDDIVAEVGLELWVWFCRAGEGRDFRRRGAARALVYSVVVGCVCAEARRYGRARRAGFVSAPVSEDGDPADLEQLRTDEGHPLQPAPVAGPDEAVEAEETRRIVAQFLEELSPRERALIEFRQGSNAKWEEVALHLGGNPTALRQQYHRLLARLRETLADGRGLKK